jgi:hypothetical protein
MNFSVCGVHTYKQMAWYSASEGFGRSLSAPSPPRSCEPCEVFHSLGFGVNCYGWGSGVSIRLSPTPRHWAIGLSPQPTGRGPSDAGVATCVFPVRPGSLAHHERHPSFTELVVVEAGVLSL